MKQKIALVGPILPYRGGIAQYTEQLQQALAAHAEIHTVSFKRLYPKFLYPGASDRTPGQENHYLPNVQYMLDVYNPFSWRKAADAIAASGCNTAIITWWTLIWQPGLGYMARRLRKHGIGTIFLCHNLANHKTGGLMGLADRLSSGMVRWLLKQADAYIVQSSEKQAELLNLKPGAQALFRIHPIYDRFPPPSETLPPRGRLELLFFGLIRPYKGLDILLNALMILNDKEIFLTVAGEAWEDVETLRDQLKSAPNVEANLRYISDQEAANYANRADAIILPYRSATGSGLPAFAYHYGKPVIAAAVGGLKDTVIEGQTGYLVQPDSPEALAEAIRQTSREQLANMRPAIEQFCQENSWDNLAREIIAFTTKLT